MPITKPRVVLYYRALAALGGEQSRRVIPKMGILPQRGREKMEVRGCCFFFLVSFPGRSQSGYFWLAGSWVEDLGLIYALCQVCTWIRTRPVPCVIDFTCIPKTFGFHPNVAVPPETLEGSVELCRPAGMERFLRLSVWMLSRTWRYQNNGSSGQKKCRFSSQQQ